MRLSEGRPSATAQRVAMRRAAHQLLDSPKVFDDPFAIPIIGEEAAAKLATDNPSTGGLRARAACFMRAFIVARSRFAEDELARAVAAGVKQYVVLGAGLDTFACRNPFPGLRVYEVDHPSTQEWKRARLRRAGIVVPESVRFTPVDFQNETFAEGLSRVGFRSDEPAFFSWLGVTMYLNRDTVHSTLRAIIKMCPANGVVFDYSVPRASLSLLNKLVFDALSKRVAAAGEPFIGFFDPAELAELLKQMGFREIESLDADRINARYFAGRSDRLRVGGALTHLMCAPGELK
jgi:methyltransferase (TIGR00027 family)